MWEGSGGGKRRSTGSTISSLPVFMQRTLGPELSGSTNVAAGHIAIDFGCYVRRLVHIKCFVRILFTRYKTLEN